MRRTIKAVLLLLWMGMIFYFSAQPAADSTVTSNGAALLLYHLYRFLGLHGATEADFLENYLPLALFLSGIYAVSDELHQLFVVNRSCEIRGMLIDVLGACLGVFLCHAIYEWRK